MSDTEGTLRGRGVTPSELDSSSRRGAGDGQSLPQPPGPVASVAARRWRKVGYVFGTLSCLFTMFAGTVFGHFYWGSATVQELINGHGMEVLWNTVVHRDPLLTWTPEKQFEGQTSFTILVLGVDRDYDNRGRLITTSPGRSDSILLARIDFVRNTIDALSIPRDTAVRIPGYRGISKINAAHNLGGPELTVQTIKSVFGVEPDAVVTLNFQGFLKIVDAIGGVDLDVEKQLDYDDNWGNLHIHLKPGYQHLTGYQAMGYVRMRHSDNDMARSKRQHAFLEALRSKIKSPSTFGRLPEAINALTDQFKFQNLTQDQLFTIANYARSLPKENIRVETLPVDEGPSFVTVQAQKGSEMIQRMFFPNQELALNIDAPGRNMIRSMGVPGERRKRGRGRHSDVAPAEGTLLVDPAEIGTGPAEPAADSGTTVTPPKSDAPTPSGESHEPPKEGRKETKDPSGDGGGKGGEKDPGKDSGTTEKIG